MKASENHTNQFEPLMTVADLQRMSEGALLRVAEILLQPHYPEMKHTNIITHVTGIPRTTVDQCKADKGSIGGAAWVKIERALNNLIYHRWLEVR